MIETFPQWLFHCASIFLRFLVFFSIYLFLYLYVHNVRKLLLWDILLMLFIMFQCYSCKVCYIFICHPTINTSFCFNAFVLIFLCLYVILTWMWYFHIFCATLTWMWYINIFCDTLTWMWYFHMFCATLTWMWYLNIFCDTLTWMRNVHMFCAAVLHTPHPQNLWPMSNYWLISGPQINY